MEFTLFSADDHIIEHANVWTDRLPARFREAGPHVVNENGRQFWVYEDVVQPCMGLNAVAGKDRDDWTVDPISFDDMIPGCYDPNQRADDFRSNGILASVSFPTLGRFGGALFLAFKDRELADLCVRAYNDFILDEWCAAAPDLYVPMIMGQLWDPQLCAAEIRRCAARGARALSFLENPAPKGLPSFFTNHWDPVFEALVETGIPACMHLGSSGDNPNPSPDQSTLSPIGRQKQGDQWAQVVVATVANVNASVCATNLLMSRTLRRFPDVKIVWSESGIGWVPFALERADHFWRRARGWASTDDLLPSELFRRNMWVSMLDEPFGLAVRDWIGVDRILWESDYPHSETPWPHSQEHVREMFKGVPDDEREAILHGNAERLFNWDISTPDRAMAGLTS
jgi:predicted TIM-barrel fold metal-dependent hydrolase